MTCRFAACMCTAVYLSVHICICLPVKCTNFSTFELRTCKYYTVRWYEYMWNGCTNALYNLFIPAPSNPRNITVTIVNATAVNIAWIEPAITNGIIRNYRITISTSDSRLVLVTNHMDVTQLSAIVDGLNHNTDYVVNITAVTVRSGESEMAMFTTRPRKFIP